jgi:hypothetical protein
MKSAELIPKGDKMDNVQRLNHKFEAIAWGAFFIWWGFTELFPSLPDGMGAVGIGLILLGLNAARSLNGIPASGFTTLGVLALVGRLELARPVLGLPFDCPFCDLLIVIGMIFLVREVVDSGLNDPRCTK